MVHLEIKETTNTILKVRNNAVTAHILSTMPKNCHWILFDAVAYALRGYEESEKVAILENIVKESQRHLDTDAAADRAIRQALERAGAMPQEWEVTE